MNTAIALTSTSTSSTGGYGVMLLRYSLDLDAEAEEIEEAVRKVLADGYRTADIYSEGTVKVNTEEMAQRIIERLS